jgi:multimeric flavodoxin WrbA
MKILALNASPHLHGNTRFLLDQVLEAAQAAGAETELLQVNPLKIRGCQGDYGCKASGRCVMQDDMQGVYDRIDQADAVVFGSPIYMWSINAQLKTVLDRLFCYFNPDLTSRLPRGKRSALLVAQNQPDGEKFRGGLDLTTGALELMGFEAVELLVAQGVGGMEDAAARPDLIHAARSLGERLAMPPEAAG